jgi:hypothetical protein
MRGKERTKWSMKNETGLHFLRKSRQTRLERKEKRERAGTKRRWSNWIRKGKMVGTKNRAQSLRPILECSRLATKIF